MAQGNSFEIGALSQTECLHHTSMAARSTWPETQPGECPETFEDNGDELRNCGQLC
jgi:hypothetical protein